MQRLTDGSLPRIFDVPVISVEGSLRLLPDRPVCHGNVCGCICPKHRRRLRKAPPATRQPWQPLALV